MSKILKEPEIHIDEKIIFKGDKSLLSGILKQSNSKSANENLMSAMTSIPSELRNSIIKLVENYKETLEKEFKSRENETYENAKRKGYEDGYNQGRIEGLNLLEDNIKGVNNVVENIGRFKNELYKDVREDVIKLALRISEEIVRQAVESNHKALISIISDAINSAADSAFFIIHLNATDYETIKKNQGLFRESVNKEARIEFLTDPSLTRGNVVIRADFGEIDARISTQLEQVKKTFVKIIPD